VSAAASITARRRLDGVRELASMTIPFIVWRL
jgi:hypothetical protein